jgi:hypothetical protein
MNIRSLGAIAKLELGAIIALVILGILWMLDPDGPYEPYLAFSGLVFVCTEFYRRYKVDNEAEITKSNQTDYHPLDNASKTKVATTRKVKPKGAIAHCSSATCNSFAMTTEEAQAYFGYRTMSDGTKCVQSYCRKCRSA